MREDRHQRKPEPVRSDTYKIARFGILNAYGQFWTPDTFDSEVAAIQSIKAFFGPDEYKEFMRGARIIPVTVTVEDARP